MTQHHPTAIHKPSQWSYFVAAVDDIAALPQIVVAIVASVAMPVRSDPYQNTYHESVLTLKSTGNQSTLSKPAYQQLITAT
jgi:hypothetical protein